MLLCLLTKALVGCSEVEINFIPYRLCIGLCNCPNPWRSADVSSIGWEWLHSWKLAWYTLCRRNSVMVVPLSVTKLGAASCLNLPLGHQSMTVWEVQQEPCKTRGEHLCSPLIYDLNLTFFFHRGIGLLCSSAAPASHFRSLVCTASHRSSAQRRDHNPKYMALTSLLNFRVSDTEYLLWKKCSIPG